MKHYYGDVTVLVKQRLRVSLQATERPDPHDMLLILRRGSWDEITEDETLEYIEVDDVAVELQEH